MGSRIVIVSIFDLTRVLYEISTAMSAAGHEIFWITTNNYWTGWLVERGVARADILELVFSPRDFLDATLKERLLNDIVADENECDLTINQIFMMDQFVMRKNKPDINEYAFLYYHHMKEFLSSRRITHLFAEPTNTNEMVAYLLCCRLGITFISPSDMRHPPRRVVFFDSYRQEKIIPRPENRETAEGRTLLETFAVDSPPPLYFGELNKQRVLSPMKLLSSISNRVTRKAMFTSQNLTNHDLSGRISLLTRRLVNGFALRHLFRYDRLNDVTGAIAYYPLHVQPESSIDVLGAYFSDQLKLVKDIRRALPFDVTLIVKEHPNFLGTKKLALFHAIRRIPNVKLIHHDESSMEILKRSAILFTISGTAALEAGMLGKPAIVFCRMFFDGFSSIHYCSDMTRLRELTHELLHGFCRDYDADCRFMEHLMANSYDAFWSDPILFPIVLSRENVAKLQNAFLSVVSRDSS